jgi:acyl-CoA synthetase (AMP-forming)/AMP-acid ligase II
MNAADHMRVSFITEGSCFELGALWDRGGSFTTWSMKRDVEVCAMLLSNTSACVACLFGAIAVGCRVVSIPLPPRGAPADWYQQFVEKACHYAGATNLLVDERLLELIPNLNGISVTSHQRVLAGPNVPTQIRGDFALIQFTSGSTADPRGVLLSESAIEANIDAILDVLGPCPGDNSLSWLPLSHDMGLIGMLLSSCIAATPSRASGGTLYLMEPEHFLRSPESWLTACTEYSVTITAAPDFGFALATRRPPQSLDLSRLRICITGGEPVRASTLGAFADRFRAVGFSSQAFCPSYGLAEAALAIAMTPVENDPECLRVDPLALADGVVKPSKEGFDLISGGLELSGYEVSVLDDKVTPLRFSGPSLCDDYIGPHSLPIDAEGRFITSDLAFRHDGWLYIIGRTDDVLLVAGRNVYAGDVEEELAKTEGLRPGRAVALIDADARFIVVAELNSNTSDAASSIRTLRARVRTQIVRRVGVAPDEVHFVTRGHLPMTSSGKVRRSTLAGELRSGALSVIDSSDQD